MSSTSKGSDAKKQKTVKMARQQNVLESLKDLGGGVGKSVKEDLLSPMSKDFFEQLFKSRQQQQQKNKSYSGEIHPGEQMPMNQVFSGEREKEEKLRQQISFERSLHQQEQELLSRKNQELKIQLQAIMQEMKSIAAATPRLAMEIQTASEQAPVNPGVYHIHFFEKLLDFMKAFRKNANEASSWLHAVNARGKKGGNVWGNNYKKSKGAYLLSSEHYLQRSAG